MARKEEGTASERGRQHVPRSLTLILRNRDAGGVEWAITNAKLFLTECLTLDKKDGK